MVARGKPQALPLVCDAIIHLALAGRADTQPISSRPSGASYLVVLIFQGLRRDALAPGYPQMAPCGASRTSSDLELTLDEKRDEELH